MSNYTFPKGFWWGSAVSATQIEGAADKGGKGENIWDHWYEEEPNRFFQQIGPTNTSDFYNRYKEDIKLMKEIGHNSFRLSISWSRLIPKGTGNVNQKAVTFYNNVLDELIANGIEPFVNLYHFDMPLVLQEIGGWENREVVEAFQDYANICFDLFGEKVNKWFTQNEPIVPVEAGYLYDAHYPNVIDFKRAIQVGYNSILASAKTIKAFKDGNYKGEIGIILNLTPSYPRSENLADQNAARIADLFFNRSFLDASVNGEFPQELIEIFKGLDYLPSTVQGDKEIIKDYTVDILGVNYYQPRRVKAKEYSPHKDAPIMPEHFFDYYEMPGRKMNPYRGWEIYEKGIYDILINLKDNYGNVKCFISENGMGVEDEKRFEDKNGMIQDDYRIDFYKEHLKWMYKAIELGSNVKGYQVWTFMDNWSWLNAYKNRYGLVSIDLDHNAERTVKKSGWWFKKLSAANGFSDQD